MKARPRRRERCVRRAEWRRCGVEDLCSGLRTNQGAMGEVRSGRATARGDFDLASAPWQSPRDSNQSVFLMIRPLPYAPRTTPRQGTRHRALGRLPPPRGGSPNLRFEFLATWPGPILAVGSERVPLCGPAVPTRYLTKCNEFQVEYKSRVSWY